LDPSLLLPTTSEQLFQVLNNLEIDYILHKHRPVYTVAEGHDVWKGIPGLHCRNLFLRDHKKKMFLIVAANETKIDLKDLKKQLNSGRLSFGSAERLWEFLGIQPGAVSPFCLINDKDRQVTLVLDPKMMDAERVNYHPLDNAMTIGIHPNDLLKFADYTGHLPSYL